MTYILMLLIMIPLAYIWQLHSTLLSDICKWSIRGKYELQLKTNFWAMLTFLPLYAVYAFQYSMHTDYDNYEKAFLKIKAGTGGIREIGVHYINKFVAASGLDFQFVYIIIYFIAFAILAKCLKDYSSDYAVSLILFVTVFFTLNLVQLRQLVAVIVCLYAYRFIATEDWWKYVFTILFACLFHVSAVIMIPAYFILKYNFKCSYYVMVIGFLGIINMAKVTVLTWLVQHFLPSYYGRHEMFRSLEINKWQAIFIIVLLFFCAIYYGRIQRTDGYNRIFLNGFFIYIILFFLGRWIIEFDRFGYYFYFPMICLVPNLLECEKNIYFKWLAKIGICMMALLFWIIMFGGGETFHYVSVFMK